MYKNFDSDGKEIWETDDNEWNSNVGYRKDSQNIVLSAGKYYMQINGYAWGKSYKSTGKYVFCFFLSQANCNHDYSSKWVDATYFEKGYRLYTCEKCGKKYKDDYVAKRQLDQEAFLLGIQVVEREKSIFGGIQYRMHQVIRFVTVRKIYEERCKSDDC